MPEATIPPARFHRVTTQRKHLRALGCPLEPELLVAEFAGELPPDVAVAVREHIAVCEICGGRSQALRAPYELLSSLGNEPVPYVPDLRDTVRTHVQSYHWVKELARFTARLGRGSTIVVTSVLGLIVLAVVLAGAILYPAFAGVTSRSQNGLTRVPAAAPGGVLYAETNKLISVTDSAGKTWQVAEVIAVNQRDSAVARSMPTANGALQIAKQEQLPPALAAGGDIIAEVTAPDGAGQQALVAIDASTGEIRSFTALAEAGQQKLASGLRASALVLSPDGAFAYVGLSASDASASGVRVLVVDTRSGGIVHQLSPGFMTTIPTPPPPGGLPPSAFPQSVPYVYASDQRPTLALGGALAISPDGAWLFDVLSVKDISEKQYAVVRRFDTASGTVAQELGLAARLNLAQLTANTNATLPQIFLVTGTPDAEVYVLDGSTQGPILEAEIPLGGPALPGNARFSGVLSLSAEADGTHLLVTQDGYDPVSAISGHDLWVVDTTGMVISAHRSTSGTAGGILANTVAGPDVKTFVLQDGQINLLDATSLVGAGAWLHLSDGQSVLQLLGTSAG